MNITSVDGIKIHTHVSGEQGAFVSACLVETARGIVAIDGTLTMSDGRHAAAIALLGNCMAGSFVAMADGHGGTLVMEAQTGQQPLLTHPPHQ